MCESRDERKAASDVTGDPLLNLLAATVRLAIEDARNGDRLAAVWLWTVAPTVAERALADVVEVSDGKQITLMR